MCLKIYRQGLYEMARKINNAYTNSRTKTLQLALDKVVNVAAGCWDDLNYSRRRAVYRLAMRK